MDETITELNPRGQGGSSVAGDSKPTGIRFYCDRCGAAMVEDRCKIICANCGSRFDCSDLNLYFD